MKNINANINLREELWIISSLELDSNLQNTPTKTGKLSESYFPIATKSIFDHLNSLNLYPVVYEGENDGKLIRHVVPKEDSSQAVSSHGSSLTFFPHVDNPDLRLRNEQNHWIKTPCPDTLSLFCLRNSERVATSLVKIDDVLADLTKKEIETLQRNIFTIKRPQSFVGDFQTKGLSLLKKDIDGEYLSRLDFHNSLAECKEGKSALDAFKKSAIDITKWKHFNLSPGECITFDNQRCLHTRDHFTPLQNGKARWLLRVFGLYEKPCSSTIKDHEYHLKTQ